MFDYTAAPDLLKDRNILVTGAGSGLGKAAAVAYARHGANVILLGRTEKKLESTYDAIVANGDIEPTIMVLDLQRAGEADYNQLGEILANEFGYLHGLLHSAGVSAPALPLQHQSMSSWNQLLQVNLTAGFALTKTCLPLLQQADNASIVFTSSRAGRETRAFRGAYAVSKHGVETMMEIFAEELRNTSRIRVNSLNPGPCGTALRRVIFPSEDPATLPTAESLLPLYLYLMGQDSLHENGKRFEAQQTGV
jgi:NAD(P)-dependent dehydrogenase (short-subunit alcohol dehydrogenase family)